MKKNFVLFIVFTMLFYSCKKKNDYVVTDYTYAGNSAAYMEQVIISSTGNTTTAWDSSYLDKIYVHYDIPAGTITFTVSEQKHACKTFQQDFTFTRNNLNTYTANSTSYQASHTFQILDNTLTATMLRYDGTDSNHTQYHLNFQGSLVQ